MRRQQNGPHLIYETTLVFYGLHGPTKFCLIIVVLHAFFCVLNAYFADRRIDRMSKFIGCP